MKTKRAYDRYFCGHKIKDIITALDVSRRFWNGADIYTKNAMYRDYIAFYLPEEN